MCSNYLGIKLEPALGTLEDKIEHLSSYAHVVHTTAKQVISRRRKNENVFKMSKNEKCTCKACKNAVFHCQICKFVGFLLPSSSWLLKLPNDATLLRKCGVHDEKVRHFRRSRLEPENRKIVREGAQLKETAKRVHGYSQAENKGRTTTLLFTVPGSKLWQTWFRWTFHNLLRNKVINCDLTWCVLCKRTCPI